MAMTSRQRVLAALDHTTPDRPPLNYYGTPETTAALLRRLALPDAEALLRHFGADMRYVGPRYVGPDAFTGFAGYGSGGTDVWGVTWQAARNPYCTYYEVAGHPLADATTVAQIDAHAWPSLDWFDVSHLAEEIRRIQEPEPRAIVWPTGTFFELAWCMRGLDRFLMDLVDQPAIAARLMERVVAFCRALTQRAVEAARGGIDIVWSSSDVGMQTGMIVSPELWRQAIRPWHCELVTPFKAMGLRTRYHTDGTVTPIIEDLIEMGVDLLDPIQPKARDMDAELLRDRFDGRIAFYGGVDTQELMPRGTPEAVAAEVLRLIDVLGRGGGYVVAASNAVQPDVPFENVLALYLTARDFRY